MDGQALRRARLACGLSLDALAEALGSGATRHQLIACVAGRCRPDPPRLVALAKALDVPPEQLAGVKPYWANLADLRHWAALTAEAAAPSFGFSRWSLLRAEKTGQLPLFWGTRDAFVRIAAHCYARPHGIVLGALRRTELRHATLASRLLG
ncbi:helix-turn-helix transcriptional regulator [Actinomadura sp. NPDC047616]|uniref:helix-turn-helix domain-containing protein n=1 Tax=Actinomadura sp. NPDC047616 TaxID=3155914 RepID=UPI003403E721